MIRTLYEIVTEKEFILMGRQSNGCSSKKIQELATKALREYQIWQRGLLNEETQEQFVKAVKAWWSAGGKRAGYITVGDGVALELR